MAAKDTDDAKPEGDEADVSLDMSQAAVKKMIADARERGYITYDQLNTVGVFGGHGGSGAGCE